jgi:hypothetical protein
MASAYENVIFPDAPMMLVHRDWRNTQQKPKPSQTNPTSASNRSRKSPSDGQSTFQTTSEDHPTITVFKVESPKKTKATVDPESEQHMADVKKKSKSAKQLRRRELKSPQTTIPGFAKNEQMPMIESFDQKVSQALISQHPDQPLSRYIPTSSETSNLIEMNHYLSHCIPLSSHLILARLLMLRVDLHAIADAMYPRSQHLSFNPTRDKWFRVAVADEMWFLTIIYVSARQLASESQNPRHMQDAMVLHDMVLEKLGRSVAQAGKGHVPSETTVCAVSCLVSMEVCGFNCHPRNR